MLERYQLGIEASGAGRYVSREAHDRRYHDLTAAVAGLESDRRIDAVCVYQRTGQPVYINRRRAGGAWQQPGAGAALASERGRKWTLPESGEFLSLHGSLAGRIPAELAADLQDALDLAGPLLHPAASQVRNAVVPPMQSAAVPGQASTPGGPGGAALLQDRTPAGLGFPASLAEVIRRSPPPTPSRSRPRPARAARTAKTSRGRA